jgi:hypothetical protein
VLVDFGFQVHNDLRVLAQRHRGRNVYKSESGRGTIE